MANRYWVGGTGTWTTTTTNWSATSGGAGGASVPTVADDVFFDQAGTYTVTITGARVCQDITVSTGTVTFTSTGTITARGSMSLVAGTIWNATGILTFDSTTTGKTITTNGTVIASPLRFQGVGGNWSLNSAVTTTGPCDLISGTITLNGFDFTVGTLNSSNANVRSIQFGTNSIILSTPTAGQTILSMANATNYTYTGTPSFISDASVTRTFVFGTTGGSATNSPKLTLTGSGTAIQTFTTGSWFNALSFGTTAFTIATTTLNLNSLTLSSGGTFTGLTVNMVGAGTITPNGKTIAALTINNSGTTTLAGALSCTTYTQTQGNFNFATFNLTCSGAAAYTAGTLTNTGTISCTTWTVNGNFELTNGTITPSVGFVVNSGSFTYTSGTLSPVLAFTQVAGTVTLGKAYALAATGTYTLTAGTLNLNGFDLTTGIFAGAGTGVRSIAFGTNNIVLAHTTAGTTVLSMATNMNNFTCTGTGGFRSDAAITRTYVFGSTGGSATNAPNLTLTGSGTAVQTFNTSSWFNKLDFGTTAFTLPSTILNVNSLTLSAGGTYTALNLLARSTGTIITNNKTIAQFYISHGSTSATTTLSGNLGCTTYLQDPNTGTFDLAFFNLTCSSDASFQANNTPINIGVITCTSFFVVNGTFNMTQGTITPSIAFVLQGTGVFNYTGGTLSPATAFTHTAGVVNLNSNLTLPATSTYTFTAGALNLNNFTLTAGAFSSNNANVRTLAFGTGNIVLNHTTAATTVVAMDNATNFNWTGTGGFSSDAAVTRTYAFGTTGGTFFNAPNLAIVSGAAVPTFTNNSWFDILDFTGSACAPAAATINVDTLILATGGTYTGLIPLFTRTQTWTAQFGKTLGGIGINRLFTTLTLGGTQTFTATSICSVITGTLDLGGYDMTVGSFSSSGTAPRTVVFGNNNIILNHSTAAQTVLAVADATNFVYTSTGGGFVSDAAVTRTFAFGTTGGSISNAPNLLIGAGAAVPTISTGSWFNRLDFTGTTSTPAATVLNVSSLTLSAGGTFTGLSVTMRSTGTIVSNGKTIAALIVNHNDPGTTTLLDALTCTTQSYIIGNVDFAGFNLTGTAATYNGGVFSNINVLACTTFTIAGNFELITGTISPSVSIVLSSGSFTYTGGTLSPVATFTHTAGTVVLNKNLALTATGTYTLTAGSLNLNGYTLTTGIFSSSGTGSRSIQFGTGNIVLAHTTAATTVLSMTDATNFTTTGTGGFVSDASITRTFACSVSGTAVDNINKPNLSITSGAAIPTITTNSYFNTLDFTGSACAPAAAIVNVNTLILATGGTYTNLTPAFCRTQTWTSQFGKQLAGIGINIPGGTLTLDGTQTYTATSLCNLSRGTLDLGGYDLSIGTFESGSTNTRSISFGANNIVLTGARSTDLDITTATNFTWTGTGGFQSDAGSAKRFAFGPTGASVTNAPNLRFTGSGTAVQTINSNSWFKALDYGTTAFNPGTTTVNLSSLTLSPNGTYTSLTVDVVGVGTIVSNGKTIAALNINSRDTETYKIYTWTSSGSITFPAANAPPTVEYLVVGGGGAGGGTPGVDHRGGGGGGGGFVTGFTSVTAGTSYNVVVGAGGSAQTGTVGSNGESSSFNNKTALGGGGGGMASVGTAGGSGGGGGAQSTAGNFGGGAATQPGSASGGLGNNGGTGGTDSSTYRNGGGGGGAGAAGGSANGSNKVDGGAGAASGISGTTVFYAGGGGGGGSTGVGGAGGGGNANTATGINNPGAPGTPNTGGGGAGGSAFSAPGGAGGSGIVIIRYSASYASPSETVGATATVLAAANTPGTVTMNGALTVTGTTTLINGRLDLNSFTLTTNVFSGTGTSVRSIAFGTSNIVLTSAVAGTTVLAMADATNFTYSGTGGFRSDAAVTRTYTFGTTSGSATNAPNLAITSGAAVTTFTDGSWFDVLDFTGSANTPAMSASALGIRVDTLTLATGGTYTGLIPVFTRTQTWTSQFSKQLGGIGFNSTGGTLTLDNTQTYTATSACYLVAGTLNLGGTNLTIGTFSSNNINPRAVAFGANSIVLATTTAAVVNLSMANAANFFWTGTGGFAAAADITRTFVFGTTEGSTSNAPNLTFTGSGAAVATLTTGSWFNQLNFGTTAFNPGTTTLNINSITLSPSGA
jgi:hypothetical protein